MDTYISPRATCNVAFCTHNVRFAAYAYRVARAAAHALSRSSVGWSFTIAALSRPRPATRGLTAQAFDPTVLEALYFVLALVDDDHEAKESAELSKRMREAAPPRLPRPAA
jgi:hypothetical protein